MMDLASNDPYGAGEFAIEQPDGSIKTGGCLDRKWAPEASPFEPWGSTSEVPMVDPADWVEQESLRVYQRRTSDQNGYPKCTLASLANAMELAMVRDGRPHVQLDDQKAWKALTGGRGGAALDDACAFAMDKGFPRLDGKGVVKIAEAWDCGSVEALGSALQRGAICTFGANVHAQCMTRLVKSKGKWCGDVVNSWGEWGEQGPTGFWGWHLFPLSNVEMRYSIIAIRELAFTDDMGIWSDAK